MVARGLAASGRPGLFFVFSQRGCSRNQKHAVLSFGALTPARSGGRKWGDVG
jgi:hypothetical protein